MREDNCPYSVKPHRNLLQGHAIFFNVSKMAGGGYWDRFEENTLSSDVKERFAQLFEIKTEWTEAELLPYLRFSFCFFLFKLFHVATQNLGKSK